jgi:Large-conductance mechanosensitive channel, MscL
MFKGFRDFILRGNVVDLAVAVVMGAAFGVADCLRRSREQNWPSGGMLTVASEGAWVPSLSLAGERGNPLVNG